MVSSRRHCPFPNMGVKFDIYSVCLVLTLPERGAQGKEGKYYEAAQPMETESTPKADGEDCPLGEWDVFPRSKYGAQKSD